MVKSVTITPAGLSETEVATVGGNNTEVQYNNNGQLAGCGNLLVVNNQIVFPSQNNSPTAPTSGMTPFVQTVANRPQLFAIDSINEVRKFQNNIYFNRASGMCAVGSGTTTFTTFSCTAWSTVGNNTGRSLSASISGQISRCGITTGTLADITGRYEPQGRAWLGSSAALGGFHYFKRFGISDPTTVANPRTFVGLSNTTAAPTNVNPATLVNSIGFAQDPSFALPGNFYIMINGTAATGYTLNTGIPITNNRMYDIQIFTVSGSGIIGFFLQNLETGATFDTTINLTSLPANQRPANNVLFGGRMWRSNNTLVPAETCGMDFAFALTETPY